MNYNIKVKLETSADLPIELHPFYSGPLVNVLSVYEFSFKTKEDAEDMVRRLKEKQLNAWMVIDNTGVVYY